MPALHSLHSLFKKIYGYRNPYTGNNKTISKIIDWEMDRLIARATQINHQISIREVQMDPFDVIDLFELGDSIDTLYYIIYGMADDLTFLELLKTDSFLLHKDLTSVEDYVWRRMASTFVGQVIAFQSMADHVGGLTTTGSYVIDNVLPDDDVLKEIEKTGDYKIHMVSDMDAAYPIGDLRINFTHGNLYSSSEGKYLCLIVVFGSAGKIGPTINIRDFQNRAIVQMRPIACSTLRDYFCKSKEPVHKIRVPAVLPLVPAITEFNIFLEFKTIGLTEWSLSCVEFDLSHDIIKLGEARYRKYIGDKN